ncbi:Hypothetical_protein [Hexamita inflata]|uniref:Hypothetical_protein n=1 Tax=Hexamita inflata TaxID=28002 RepID=A0AA86PH53_9EUKA|nr:Hypothetical protein HINF_LOCUS24773 [Hexamita inflata]
MIRFKQEIISEIEELDVLVGIKFITRIEGEFQNTKTSMVLDQIKKQLELLLLMLTFFNKKVRKDKHGNIYNVIETTYSDGVTEQKAINSGFCYLFVPIEIDAPPLLLFFQLHDTGHATQSTVDTMFQIKAELSKYYLITEGFCKDGDNGYKTLTAFEVISDSFFEKQSFNVYSLLSQKYNGYISF